MRHLNQLTTPWDLFFHRFLFKFEDLSGRWSNTALSESGGRRGRGRSVLALACNGDRGRWLVTEPGYACRPAAVRLSESHTVRVWSSVTVGLPLWLTHTFKKEAWRSRRGTQSGFGGPESARLRDSNYWGPRAHALSRAAAASLLVLLSD
jgi:hypothetical protein